MQGTIERALPSDASAAGLARKAVGDVDGLGDELRGDLRLLVTELVTNSIRHAGLSADEAVVLRIRAGSTVRVEVWDGGAGFTRAAQTPAQGAHSGWGLFLVERLSTRWGIERTSRTCVWAEIDVRPAEAPRDDGPDVGAVLGVCTGE